MNLEGIFAQLTEMLVALAMALYGLTTAAAIRMTKWGPRPALRPAAT